MASILVIMINPLSNHGLCFFEKLKIVKPNTFLFQRSEKTFYNAVPVRFPFIDILLGDSPVTCAGNLLAGQEYRSIVMTNFQSLWNSLFGAIPSHYSLIQGIRCLKRPAPTVKTVSCNLTTPIVNYRNQLTPSIPPTVYLGKVRRPKFIRLIHRGPHHLSRFAFTPGRFHNRHCQPLSLIIL
jgi:hypothetical protein